MHSYIEEERDEDIEMADLKCKEVHQIRHLSYHLSRDFKKESEKRIGRILTRMFEEHLRSNKLIVNSKDARQKNGAKLEYYSMIY